MKIKIKVPDDEELEELKVSSWPVWEKEVSEFEWYYSETEICYILEGEVIVKTEEGEFHIKKGDLVRFEKGLNCVWKINKPIRKHYIFEDIKI